MSDYSPKWIVPTANEIRRSRWCAKHSGWRKPPPIPDEITVWHAPRHYRFWRWWFRVVRRMTFHRYLIHMRKFGLGD